MKAIGLGTTTDEQKKTYKELDRIVQIFINSRCALRPHFILTGGSGTGKSYIISKLAEQHKVNFLEINAAQLTKEGTAGNSLSKALTPLTQFANMPTICFVDEFDKLFISGNTNTSLAHETTNGVQNEFLKVLESDETSVYGDYGKYLSVGVKNVLFVFAGAFNGEQNITIDRLRTMGIKTEFLGRVGLTFNIEPVSIDSMVQLLYTSPVLESYLDLFQDTDRDKVCGEIKQILLEKHDTNTLGVRLINTLIHQYFIKGGNISEETKTKTGFNTKMSL